MSLYTELISKLPGMSTENEKGFKASRRWVDNLKRSGIHSVVRHREAVSSNSKVAEAFTVEFNMLMSVICRNNFLTVMRWGFFGK